MPVHNKTNTVLKQKGSLASKELVMQFELREKSENFGILIFSLLSSTCFSPAFNLMQHIC